MNPTPLCWGAELEAEGKPQVATFGNYTEMLERLIVELLHLIRVAAHPEHLATKPVLCELMGDGSGNMAVVERNFIAALKAIAFSYRFRRSYIVRTLHPVTKEITLTRQQIIIPPECVRKGMPVLFGLGEYSHQMANERRYEVLMNVFNLADENGELPRGLDAQTVKKRGIESDIVRHVARHLMDYSGFEEAAA